MGLALWSAHPLGFEHAARYVLEMQAKGDTIDRKIIHPPATNPVHHRYGDCVYTYRRNRHTHWHFIYNWHPFYRVAYVNKILNNFTTEYLAAMLDEGEDIY